MNLASGMRCRRLALASGLALLAGCAGMPERVPQGSTRAQIEERLGRPTAEHRLPDGTRLQYSRQPAGAQVYNLDLGPDGRLRRQEQVMDVAWLERIEVGRWTRDDVLLHLGRPAWVERVARFDGDIWTYRVIEHVWQRRVHIHLSPAGVVQKVMYSDEPMPDDRTP
jgi:outer membrane protein assembly factor BamE (lipoprotein component of BamABCDE complex)